jgi:hypothetical protein
MADIEELKREGQQKFASVKQKLGKLTSPLLSNAQRIETRKAMISDFDEIKVIFEKLNELESPN